MKKMLALLLAAVMISVCCPVFADTLEIAPGTPAACDIDTFKVYFGALTSGGNYTFTFDDGFETEGDYQVYTASTGDSRSALKVYTRDGNFCFAECAGSMTASVGDTDTAGGFAEWFGAAFGGIILSVYIGEGNPADQATIEAFNSDIVPLLTDLMAGLSDANRLAEGIVCTGTVLGYPAGMEVNGSVEDITVTLNLRVAVTGTDGQLIRK